MSRNLSLVLESGLEGFIAGVNLPVRGSCIRISYIIGMSAPTDSAFSVDLESLVPGCYGAPDEYEVVASYSYTMNAGDEEQLRGTFVLKCGLPCMRLVVRNVIPGAVFVPGSYDNVSVTYRI